MANSRKWPRLSTPARGATPRPNRDIVSMVRADAKSDRGKGKSDFPTRKIITTPIRLSFPHVFDPRENDQGAEYWETEALIPPTREGDDLRKQILEGLEDVMTEAFGPEDEWPRGRNDYHPADKLKYADKDKLPGPGITPDWTIIRARSYQPVGVVDVNKDEVLNKREVYGGRWARLSITLAAYDSKKSKGVTIYLNNVQLLDHDESFGGRPSADQDFDRWDGEELAPGGRRERDDRGSGSRRDDRRDRDDREDRASGEGRRSGRGEGDRARSDGRGADRAGAREARDEGRSDRSGSRLRGDSVRVDERASGRGSRDQDRRGDDRVSDRDRGEDRDRGGGRNSRDGGRSSDRDEGRRGRDRDEDRGRDRDDRDQDTRSDRRSARDDRDDDRRGGRGRDREDDRRPSDRGRDRDREDDENWT